MSGWHVLEFGFREFYVDEFAGCDDVGHCDINCGEGVKLFANKR